MVWKVPYSYLEDQFRYPDLIWKELKDLVKKGDFTLGKPLQEFEARFAELCQTKYGVGVGTGTDALRLSLLALGIGRGDEVITTPNTFFATVGAIVTTWATPVFVDVQEDYNINPALIEDAITDKTKAIMPVHLNGCPAAMDEIISIAKRHNLYVIEDSCQAINASLHGRKTGSFGITGGFSLHPLKNINVWGDGGIIVTNSLEIRDKLLLLRNHGLINRDECVMYAYNCRLDTFQAVIGNYLMKDVAWITEKRVEHGKMYDEALSKTPQIAVPERKPGVVNVHHNYVVMAEQRDKLLKFLIEQGIDAKIHYPIPLHLQKASSFLPYKKGDFPVAEKQVSKIISLPVHQHLTEEQLHYVITKVKEFYAFR